MGPGDTWFVRVPVDSWEEVRGAGGTPERLDADGTYTHENRKWRGVWVRGTFVLGDRGWTGPGCRTTGRCVEHTGPEAAVGSLVLGPLPRGPERGTVGTGRATGTDLGAT